MIYLYIGLGGIAGSLLRYFVSILTIYLWNPEFPLATLTINLTGSFLLGWFLSKFSASKKLSAEMISMISTGVIGSYTTFSTFCLESIHLIEAEMYLECFLYIFVSLVGGLILVRIGGYLGTLKEKEARTKYD